VDAATLDPEVRAFMRVALEHGLRTLPSCAGHIIHDPHDLEAALDGVEDDARAIRGGLLVLQDTEGPAQLRPCLPGWRPPARHLLADALTRNSGRGAAGLVLPRGQRVDLRPLTLPGRSRAWLDRERLLLVTRCQEAGEVADLWARLAHRLPDALRG
jgi:hypothetical protein